MIVVVDIAVLLIVVNVVFEVLFVVTDLIIFSCGQ